MHPGQLFLDQRHHKQSNSRYHCHQYHHDIPTAMPPAVLHLDLNLSFTLEHFNLDCILPPVLKMVKCLFPQVSVLFLVTLISGSNSNLNQVFGEVHVSLLHKPVIS